LPETEEVSDPLASWRETATRQAIEVLMAASCRRLPAGRWTTMCRCFTKERLGQVFPEQPTS